MARLAGIPTAHPMIVQDSCEVVRRCWKLLGIDRELPQVTFEATLENGPISKVSCEPMQTQRSRHTNFQGVTDDDHPHG